MALCRHACSCTPSSPLISSTRFFRLHYSSSHNCSAGAAPPYVGIYTLYVAVRRASPSGSGWCSSAAQSPQRRGQRGCGRRLVSRLESSHHAPWLSRVTRRLHHHLRSASAICGRVGSCVPWSSGLRTPLCPQSAVPSGLNKSSFQDRRGDAPRVAT